MGSSPGFGSTPTDFFALLRLAFAAATVLWTLTLPVRCNSPVRSTKSTPSSDLSRTSTGCKHTVSGSLSLPSRGAFHLSLTVLLRYRSLGVFSLGRWSSRIPTGFHVPRGTWDALWFVFSFSPTGLLPSVAGRSSTIRLKIFKRL